MHEGNFTQQIVDAILEELTKYPEVKPKTVKVLVGEMLHLVPESVQMHCRLVTQGTPLEGVELQLAEIPVRVRCRDCGHEGGVEDHHLLLCAECSTMNVDLIEGNKIRIDSIELETKA